MKQDQPKAYISRNGTVKVSPSTQHKDMWNISTATDGKQYAHSLHASEEVIHSIYPVDVPKEKLRVTTKVKKA